MEQVLLSVSEVWGSLVNKESIITLSKEHVGWEILLWSLGDVVCHSLPSVHNNSHPSYVQNILIPLQDSQVSMFYGIKSGQEGLKTEDFPHYSLCPAETPIPISLIIKRRVLLDLSAS